MAVTLAELDEDFSENLHQIEERYQEIVTVCP